MLQYLSASIVYPVSTAPLKKGVLVLEADGTVISVLSAEEAKVQGIIPIFFEDGVLIPGLINTHCHLELSHLFEKIPEHTGLQDFVRQVIKHRGTEENRVLEAMYAADVEMYKNGIVAVGDISNLLISRGVKLSSELYYHTFVETLGFDPQKAVAIMEKSKSLRAAFSPLTATVNPHAPYSVSKELFAEIRRYSATTENLISMHNQETVDENLLFEEKKGAFVKLYEFLGLDISFFDASGKSSLQSVLPELPAGKTLLVHNTYTNEADVTFAQSLHENLFWCLCPNANLYIENRLPQVKMLQQAGLKITLGTDSLASNKQLNILAEMKTLQEWAAEKSTVLEFEDLLRWGTLNGAEFLGIDAQFGSFEVGKKPGINLITGMVGGQISALTTIKRIR
ncbi:cytosine/adenosine deaminase-related metal-dependent hydrolase [Pedobacter sp. CG_S7]|uniref:amidohydrolase family protein n=1 Tax=Pedobacter sp. CG_S7 TaxID=3143930 RepID=UPI00339823A6